MIKAVYYSFWLFILLHTSTSSVAGYRGLKLSSSSEEAIMPDMLVYVVQNIGYESASGFHVSYSSTSSKSAHRQAAIVNDFLRKTEQKFLVSLDDISLFLDGPKRKRKFTLLLIDSIEAFERLRTFLITGQYDTSGKHMILITQKLDKEEIESLMQMVFDEFFSHYLVNVEVIVKNVTTGWIDFYTYFPVSPRYCFKVIPVLHGTLNVLAPQSNKHLDLFPHKLDNLFGCPLKVVTFPFPPHVFIKYDNTDEVKVEGIDIKVLYGVADKLNFSVDFIDAKERGFQKPDGNLTGALKILFDSEANITIGGFGSASKAMVLFSASFAYLNTAMVFAIPPLQEYSPLERLLLPFDFGVWLSIGMFFCCAIFASILLKAWKRSYRDFVFGSTVRYPALEMIKIFLGGSVARFPNDGISRAIIVQWLLASMILSSCYNAILFGMLKTGFLKKYPTTVEGMLDAGFVIDVPVNLMQNLKDGPLGGRDGSFCQLKYFIQTHYAILQTGESKRMVIDTNIQLEYFNSIYYQNGILSALPQRLFIFPMYIYFRKESYLVEPIDNVLRWLLQGGLIGFWEDSVLNVGRLNEQVTSRTTNPLEVGNFIGCFALCGILIVCSVIVFILEIMSLRINVLKTILEF